MFQKINKTRIFLCVIFCLCSRTTTVECSIIHGPHNNFNLFGPPLAGISAGNDPMSPFGQGVMDFLRVLKRKTYSGQRVSKDSVLKVSWYVNTVAIEEMDQRGNILNCEIIDAMEKRYKNSLLKQLSRETNPQKVNLEKMTTILYNCQKIRSPFTVNFKSRVFREHLRKIEALLLLRIIIPGTRWCGISDIAINYHDLGSRKIDKCCRSHDLCPESLVPLQSSWNITNPGPFTRSHCLCDNYFKRCLMDVGNEDAKAAGNLYFNLLKVPCIEDTYDGKRFREAEIFPVNRL